MKKNSQKKQRDTQHYGLPPQNIEAEASLLSALLINNHILDDVVDLLIPSDFYRTAHHIIFGAMLELAEKREPIDLVTLTNILKDRGELESVGGALYLAKLIDAVPLAVNAEHYAKIIHDKATLRRLIEKGYAIIKSCFGDQEHVDEIVDFAESCVFEVSERKVRPSFFKVRELIDHGYDTLQNRQKNKGLPTGVPTGFTGLDNLTCGLQNSDLIILAARPSMGKTAFALNVARNAAVESGVPVAVFSLEMSKEQLVMRLLNAESMVSSDRFRDGFISKGDWEKLNKACSTFYNAPIYIDDSADNSVLTIRAKSRRLKMEKGLGLVIIDYLQLMKVARISERRDLEISEISKALKGLAKELEIPVVALSQLNRQLERRDDKRPRLSDLRESGSLEQDADVVAFIHREEVFKKNEDKIPFEGKAELIVAKQRNGPTDTLPLAFLKAYSRFENLALDEY
ncbi:MAG: replicative DNA helicase [Deltaproteobacteria bacterium]|nr:replicative DNA helicase [Deltaproteobacteria bacterium]